MSEQIDISMELVEKSLLGSMLQENYLITDSNIDSEFFNSQVHRSIFTAMQELLQKGKAVDYISLLTTREPSEIGGANYISDLKSFGNAHKFDDYRELLVDHWREGKKKSILLQAQTENWGIEEVQKALDKIQEDKSDLNLSIKQDLIEMAERPYQPVLVEKGVATGLEDLDRMLNGFQKSELIIIAARPSVGKTDTMNHFALNAGWRGYLPIVFSLEMSKRTLLDRLIATTGRFNRLKMRDPFTYFSEEQKAKWLPTITQLDQANLHIDDHSGLKVSQIKAKARQVIKANPNRKPIIFIDYLQIIRPDNPKLNATQQVAQISWDLKQMAKEFDCPVVCLSQLNRSVESRADKRPLMSDLRDSGNIEQDADVIAFLYRDDYYDKESESKNILEIIIAKHRNGPTGTVSVAYSKETGCLTNIKWRAVS